MLSNALAQVSLESVHGYQRGTCGYCHNPKGFVQVGFKIDCMPLQIYQDMINRGWSRYGNYYYKLDVSESCCKMFSHRLDVTKYKIRKSHKKALRKWNKFLAGQDFKRRDSVPDRQKSMEVEGSAPGKIIIPEEIDEIQEELNQVYCQYHEEINSTHQDLLYQVLNQILNQLANDQKDIKQALGIKREENFEMDFGFRTDIKVFKANSKKYGDFSTNFLLLLYADNKDMLMKAGVDSLPDFVTRVKRLLNEKLLLLPGGMNINVQSNGYIGFIIPEKNLKKEHSDEHQEKKRHNWCTVMTPMTRCQSSSDVFKRPDKSKNAVLKALKLKTRNKLASENGSDQPEQLGKVTKGVFTEVIREQREGSEGRKFEIKMEKAKFERESFELYRRYCSRRHPGSNKDEKTYRQFMCLQALEYDECEIDGHKLQFGCYHIKYYLDEKLIAVDVVDILPTSFYSVYFFYDPDYSQLSLGVISVLKEIEYMQRMQKIFPGFKYYQMGGYVQTSTKMSYKSDYEPAELLCPCTCEWVLLDEETKRKIDNHQIKLANAETKILGDLDFSNVDLDKFVKENVKIRANKATNLLDLGEIGQKYFIKVFKDITTGLGKELIHNFEFGMF